MSKQISARPCSRPLVMAVLLGTALSTLSVGSLEASTPGDQEATLRAIQAMDRYCAACWRNARLPSTCWEDCTQEVFRRLLQRVPTQAWSTLLQGESPERKEFLRAIDAVKKHTQRARKCTGSLEGVPDRHPVDIQYDDERETVRQAAQTLLSDRQQEILQLSLDGWSVQQISEQMTIAPERVSDEKYKAIRKLRDHLGEHTASRA